MADEATNVLEALLTGEAAPEPAGATPNAVVHPGDNDVPPIVVSSLSSAGYTYIYDTRTGDRSVTNNNMLPTQLKKLRRDGSRVFTTVKPNVEVLVGTFKCLLHADSPDRPKYAAFGWDECEASHFRSEFHLERHMASKHKAEWAALKDAKDKAEKAEDRAFQRAILEGRRPKGGA